jgi:hypothetical protein
MSRHQSQTTVVRTSRGLSIAGTRLTRSDIRDYVKADWPPTLIRQWFDVSDQQIAEGMACIAAHRDEVAAAYPFVLDQAEVTCADWEERNRERLAAVGQLPPEPGQEAAVAKLRARKAELGMP